MPAAKKIFLLIGMLIVFASLASADPLFNDSFEDGDCSDWIDDGSPCVINSVNPFNGTYNALFVQNDPGWRTSPEISGLGGDYNTNISFWTNSTCQGSGYCLFGGSASSTGQWNDYVSLIRMNTGGSNYVYYAGTTQTDSGFPLQHGVWVRITIEHNNSNGYWNFYVNDTLVASTIQPYSGLGTRTRSDLDVFQLRTNAANNFYIDNVLVYNYTEFVPSTTQFQVTSLDNYTASNINNFTIFIQGTGNLSTTNGTIITSILTNETALYNITVYSNQSGGYFSKEYFNLNVSTNLQSSLYQAIFTLNASEIITGNSIQGGNFFIGTYQVANNNSLYLAAGTYNVTFQHPDYYNKTEQFTVSALDNISSTISNVYDSILNVSALDVRSGTAITSFTTNATYGSFSFNGSTSSGYVYLGLLKNLTYNVSISASGYETGKSALVPVNQTFQNYSFELYTTNSIRIFVRDESSNTLIAQNVSISVITNVSQSDYVTNNGSLYLDGLDPNEYQLLFNSSGYSPRTYTITVGNGSSQQLTAYLASSYSTTIFTITDQDTGEVLENVLSTMYRFINNSWEPVESKYTDITGKVQFSYLPNVNYKFYLSKSNYQDYIFYLNPILFSTYSVGMSKSSTIDQEQDFDKISVIYAPTSFNYGNVTDFNWIVSSPSGELINYGFTLIYPGGSSSVGGSNAIGEQLTTSINITSGNIFSQVQLNYYYETTTTGVRNFTYYFPISFPAGTSGYTFISNRNQTYGLGIFERVLVVTLIIILVMGIAALVGQPIPGLALSLLVFGFVVYIGFIPLWLILIPCLFGVIFLIWKSGG